MSFWAIPFLLSLDSFLVAFALGAYGVKRHRVRFAAAVGVCDGAASCLHAAAAGTVLTEGGFPFPGLATLLLVAALAAWACFLSLRKWRSSTSRVLWILPVAMSLDNLVSPAGTSFVSIEIAAVLSGLLCLLGFGTAAWFAAARSEGTRRVVASGAIVLAIIGLVLLGD
jgi:putative Mn2+ efflux pump MntP